MKFNINNYKGRYVMHCKTDDEARKFCDYLHSIGKMWNINIPYKYHTNWRNNTIKTCYNFNEGLYNTIDHYISIGYTILEFSDFNWSTEFTKADLKDGMVVEYNNGNRRMVLGKYFIGESSHAPLADYTEDLREPNFPKQTINKVYISSTRSIDYLFDDDNLTLIWERKEKPEPEEMTIEEICRALGKEIKIIKG